MKGCLVDIILGYTCNSECFFCALGEEHRHLNMDTATVQRHLASAAKEKPQPRRVRFGGGEPTARRDLPLLAAYARGLGYREIAVQSNGFLYCDQRLPAALQAAGVTHFNVSVRGHTADLQDSHTRKQGSFEAVISGLKQLLALKPVPAITLDVILSRLLLPHLEALTAFYMDLGIRRFNFWHMAGEGRVQGHEREWIPPLSETAAALLPVLALGTEHLEVYYVPPCLLPGFEERVWNPAEEQALVITPQASFRLENAALDLGRYVAGCEGCTLKTRCPGPRPSYVEIFGESEFQAR